MDLEDLRASPKLGPALTGALDDSDVMILVASPSARASTYVTLEVEHFSKRSDARIFAVLAAGTIPDALPSILAKTPQDTPTTLNLKTIPFDKVVVSLVAGVLDEHFDALWQRDRRRARLRKGVLAGVALACLMIGALASLKTLRQLDVSSLVTASTIRSNDGWQNAWRSVYFEPALRAGIAALEPPGSLPWRSDVPVPCDLREPVDRALCAVRLSGLSVASTRVWGEEPTDAQANIRLDIGGDSAASHLRRMITAQDNVRRLRVASATSRLAMKTSSDKIILVDPKIPTSVLDASEMVTAFGFDSSGRKLVRISDAGGLSVLDLMTGRTATIAGSWVGDDIWFDAETSHWFVADHASSHSSLAELDSSFHSHDRWSIERSGVYTPKPWASRAKIAVFVTEYGDGGRLQVVDTRSGEMRSLQNPEIGRGVGQVKAVSVDPDGEFVVLGGNGSGSLGRSGAQVISLETGEEKARLVGHASEVYVTAVLPSRHVVTGGADFSIRIWTPAGVELVRLIGHVAPIQDLAVEHDGRGLFSASWDGTVRRWNIDGAFESSPVKLRAALCPGSAAASNTTLTPAERKATRAYWGRPWDVCAWRGLGSLEGWHQALTAVAVRFLGWESLDYPQPSR